jgi:molecular chaperone HscB
VDPFMVFGLPPGLDLEPKALEARYRELSRACHPDHHASGDAEAQLALLSRAAAVNDAYRILRDPWRRAEAVIDRHAPQALAARKSLSPVFLSEALELAEEVADAASDQEAQRALRARISALLAADWTDVQAAVAADDWDTAATRLHESRYHRKALADLSQ